MMNNQTLMALTLGVKVRVCKLNALTQTFAVATIPLSLSSSTIKPMQNKGENDKARLLTGAEINGKQVAKKRGLKMCHGCRKYVKYNSKTYPQKNPK